MLIIKQLLTLSDSAQQSCSLSQAKSSAGPDRYPRWSCSAAGAKLAKIIFNDSSLPKFVALRGDLGAGKTEFTRGFASVANWLIMEMAGLSHIAMLYPFLIEAKAWGDYAFSKLAGEIDVQSVNGTCSVLVIVL